MQVGTRKKEVRQRIRSTDVTDVSPMQVGTRKKEQGRRNKEEGKNRTGTILAVAVI
ncbi:MULTISPECIES: hypothetical protein [unclassified Microcoleus]|uniref:hypothetical protein n=1 Tax=unclassified Microcoleus TaxID=2642155 RepID=UPI002FD35CA5